MSTPCFASLVQSALAPSLALARRFSLRANALALRLEIRVALAQARTISALSLLATVGLTALLLLLASTASHAQSSGGVYAITSHSIDAGGGKSAGGVYELQATIGQADTAKSSGGVFELSSGFNRARVTTPLANDLFANGFE